MKAIVTGATGFLGRHLVEMLSGDGWDVIAMGRNRIIGASLEKNAITFKEVDITSMSSVFAAWEPVDVVFHCAALSSVWGSYEEFHRVNVQGTRNILRVSEQVGAGRLIYVSSTSVYFDFNNRLDIKETDSPAKTFANHYAKTKWLGERVLFEEKSSTFESVVIRPRGIIGDGDQAIMPRIMRIARKGWFPLFNHGQALVDVTYVKNVAQSMLLCAKTNGIDGECFNISNDEPMQVLELLEKAISKQKIKVKFVNVPYFLIANLARLIEKSATIFRLSEPPLTYYGVGLLAKSQTLNILKAKTILGYKPTYSIDEGIDRYLKWENGNGF